ncbi:MAG: hypothetical protein JKY10_08140 [Cohaesibacteraceae bacterium]|nr:hypothetical protein [Cohaesibacteraceae bacterium]
MSIFDAIPDKFPHEVNLIDKSITFDLKSDPLDEYISIFISLVIFVVAAAIAIFATRLWEPWLFGQDGVIKAIGAAVIAAFGCYQGFSIIRIFNRMNLCTHVEISSGFVKVSQSGRQAAATWSKKISEYSGLVVENRGIAEIDGEKKPILALVMQHEDPAFSIPLIITSDSKISQDSITRASNRLGLQHFKLQHSTQLGSNIPTGTIVANLKQSTKLVWFFRFITLVAVVTSIGGLLMFMDTGYSVADNVTDWPNSQQLIWGGVIVGLGILCVLAMWFYMSRYVIWMQGSGDQIVIKTASPWGSTQHRFNASQITDISYRDDKSDDKKTTPLQNIALRVDAPWLYMSVENISRPFIIDMQADYVNMQQLEKLGEQPDLAGDTGQLS